MKVLCILNFNYKTASEAQAIAQSVNVDNYDFVKIELAQAELTSKIESKSIPSLIHTLDDYLACIGLAERVLNKIPNDLD
ncbi:MAG: hypothetical protein KAJ51_06315 [Thermoplasmata archaeon]|nr:hypothetical protein [Thermoplasmata archaeon]